MQINNLTITHRYTHKVLVKNLNLTVNNGDKIAIIGEEGNGKSTILKAIYFGSLDYAIIKGQILNSAKIGYLPQSIDERWLTSSVEEFFLKNDYDDDMDYDYYSIFQRVERMFKELNLMIDFNRTISTLSGGEKIKLQIIKLLMNDSEILLLDEPTNDLDLESLVWLEEYIMKLEIPVIFISHDETLLERTANKIVHIEQLKKKNEPKHTVKKIDYNTYVKRRKAQLSHQEQVAHSERREHKKQMDRFRHVYARVEHEQNVVSRQAPSVARLLAKKMKALKSQQKRFEDKEFTEIPVVEEAIYFDFPECCFIPNGKDVVKLKIDELKVNEKVLSKNVFLEVVGNEKIVIIGKNGVGKTTLLKEVLTEVKSKSLRVGYFPQNYYEILSSDMSGVKWLESETSVEEHIIRSYMGSLRFTREEMLKTIGEYSGGQKAKLCILRLILLECDVLILDEPTRNFSPLSNPVLREALVGYPGCIIAISHDRKFINEVANKIYELSENGLEKIKWNIS
ncbi:ATP-binding cassette domain-containing protein [Mycoplasmatota bacterium zrk1]